MDFDLPIDRKRPITIGIYLSFPPTD